MSAVAAVRPGLSDSFGVSGLKRRLEDVEMQTPSKKTRAMAEADTHENQPSDSASSAASSAEHTTIPDSTSTPATPASQSKNWRPYVYHCPRDDCDRVFNRPCRLAEHMRAHTDERPYKCVQDGCDKAFRRDTHLARHIKTAHTDERNYACEWPGCGKRFANGTRMRRHYDTHAAKEQFRCTAYPPCSETFRKHKTLQSHVAAVHLSQKPWPCKHVDEETGMRCERAYNTEGKLRSHQAKAHSGELRFVCTLCAAAQDSHAEADEGQEEESTPRFATHTALKEHIREAHPPRCEECDMAFASQGELASHIDQLHTEENARTLFRCEEPGCSKAFARRNNLKEHVRTVHRGEKRFVCGVTDVAGSSKFEERNEHGAVVTRHEWAANRGCQRSFGTKATLEEHIRTQHLGLEGSVRAKKRMQMLAEGRDPEVVAKLGKRVGGMSGKGSKPRKVVPANDNDASWDMGQPMAPKPRGMPVGKFYLGGLGEQDEDNDEDMMAGWVGLGDGDSMEGYEHTWRSPSDIPLDPVLQFLELGP